MGAEAALGFVEDELDEGSDDEDFEEDDDNDAGDEVEVIEETLGGEDSLPPPDDENEDEVMEETLGGKDSLPPHDDENEDEVMEFTVGGEDSLPPRDDESEDDTEDTENKDRSEAANLVDELADGAADCVVNADHPDASNKDATYWEVAQDMKCPLQGGDRLFKLPDVKNVKECYKKCKNTVDCVNFSVGMHENKRNCIGCRAQGLTGFEKHAGFTAYELTPKGVEKKKISKNCPDKKDKQKKVDAAVDKAQKQKNKGGRCKATGWGDPQ